MFKDDEYAVWFADGELEIIKAYNAVDAMIHARKLHVEKGMTWLIHSVYYLPLMRGAQAHFDGSPIKGRK